MTGGEAEHPTFRRDPAPPGSLGDVAPRPYDPGQTRRRLRDLVVFVDQAAQIVAAGHDAFVAKDAWQPRAAATYLIIEIASVAEKLHSRVKEHFHTVPWRQIAQTRNIAAHQYDDVNDEIVWAVLSVAVPRLAVDLGLPASPDDSIELPDELAETP